jgi:hypothetical protein
MLPSARFPRWSRGDRGDEPSPEDEQRDTRVRSDGWNLAVMGNG